MHPAQGAYLVLSYCGVFPATGCVYSNRHLSVLVLSGCSDKKLGGLHIRTLLLTVTEAGTPQVQVLASSVVRWWSRVPGLQTGALLCLHIVDATGDQLPDFFSH